MSDHHSASGDYRGMASRDAYRSVLVELARQSPEIICLDSDMGGLETVFGSVLPDQYLNVGIAEANMMSVAAGMASTGLLPYANTLASFAVARACEQVKVDIAGTGLPVRIAVTHAGLSAGPYGPTHHAVEDIAIMRALPNMTIVVPCDADQTAQAVRATAHLPGPLYLRLGRHATPPVTAASHDFELGKAQLLRDGDDLTIIATGPYPVLRALEAADALHRRGIDVRVLNMHTIKPLDVAAVKAACDTRGIVTVEDHRVIGGLGSAVCEVAAALPRACPVTRMGVPDGIFEDIGNEEELLDALGLTADGVEREALALLGRPRG